MTSVHIFLTRIKPLCDEVIQNPNKEKINNLKIEFEKIDSDYLTELQDYLLTPLLFNIDNLEGLNKNETKTELIVCINTLLKKIKLRTLVSFKTIIIVLMSQIYDLKLMIIIPNTSEEFKLSVIECIDTVCNRISPNMHEQFYTKENNLFVARVSHMSVQIIENEEFIKLRIAAVKCIMSIFQVHNNADFNDKILRYQIAKITFIFLPKILGTLLKITQEDDKNGILLKISALKAIGRILCVIFEDYDNKQFIEITVEDFKKIVLNEREKIKKTDGEILGLNFKQKDIGTKMNLIETIERNEEWMTAASKLLLSSLKVLEKIRTNLFKQLRYELASLSCDLLHKCFINMKSCLPHFLETLITLSEDADTRISDLSIKTLNQFIEKNEKYNIFNEIESLFNQHLLKLPRIIIREETNELLSALMLLKGYIKLINIIKLKTILNDKETLELLFMILITSVELEQTNNFLLFEEYHSKCDNIKIQEYNLPWKKFKFLITNELVNQIKEICSLLVSSDYLSQLIVNNLIDNLNINRHYSNEIIILLTFMQVNLTNKNIIDQLLNEYLQEFHWNLTINADINRIFYKNSNSKWLEEKTVGLYESRIEVKYTDMQLNGQIDEYDKILNIAESRFHILHICLILEATGNLSIFYRENNFNFFLFKIFHKILEKAGSRNSMISSAAMYALDKIRYAYGKNFISELIYDNADYLIYQLKLLFRNKNNCQTGLDILCVILKHSSIIILPYLETIINELIGHDFYKTENITSILKVLEMSVNAIKNWLIDIIVMDKSSKKISFKTEIEILNSWINLLAYEENDISCIRQYDNINSKLDELTKTEFIDNIVNNDQNNEENNDIDKKIETDNILPAKELTMLMLNVSIKFISSKNNLNKLIALDTINNGISIMKNYENDLLPLVHLIWTPLAERFLEKNLILLNSSLTLLITLGKFAKDFIRLRTLKCVFPILNSFLKESAEENLKHKRETYTQSYKLQFKLLSNYADLIRNLEIDVREMNKVMDVVIIYANKRQPLQLQNCSKEFFLNIYKYDPTSVYIKTKNIIELNL